MKHQVFLFPDGSKQHASTAIEAFILYNAKRIDAGYGIVNSCKDEDGKPYYIQVIDHH